MTTTHPEVRKVRSKTHICLRSRGFAGIFVCFRLFTLTLYGDSPLGINPRKNTFHVADKDAEIPRKAAQPGTRHPAILKLYIFDLIISRFYTS